jgi:hypothetical protein
MNSDLNQPARESAPTRKNSIKPATEIAFDAPRKVDKGA